MYTLYVIAFLASTTTASSEKTALQPYTQYEWDALYVPDKSVTYKQGTCPTPSNSSVSTTDVFETKADVSVSDPTTVTQEVTLTDVPETSDQPEPEHRPDQASFFLNTTIEYDWLEYIYALEKTKKEVIGFGTIVFMTLVIFLFYRIKKRKEQEKFSNIMDKLSNFKGPLDMEWVMSCEDPEVAKITRKFENALLEITVGQVLDSLEEYPELYNEVKGSLPNMWFLRWRKAWHFRLSLNLKLDKKRDKRRFNLASNLQDGYIHVNNLPGSNCLLQDYILEGNKDECEKKQKLHMFFYEHFCNMAIARLTEKDYSSLSKARLLPSKGFILPETMPKPDIFVGVEATGHKEIIERRMNLQCILIDGGGSKDAEQNGLHAVVGVNPTKYIFDNEKTMSLSLILKKLVKNANLEGQRWFLQVIQSIETEKIIVLLPIHFPSKPGEIKVRSAMWDAICELKNKIVKIYPLYAIIIAGDHNGPNKDSFLELKSTYDKLKENEISLHTGVPTDKPSLQLTKQRLVTVQPKSKLDRPGRNVNNELAEVVKTSFGGYSDGKQIELVEPNSMSIFPQKGTLPSPEFPDFDHEIFGGMFVVGEEVVGAIVMNFGGKETLTEDYIQATKA